MIDRLLFSLPGIKKVLLLLTGIALLVGCAVLGQAWSLSYTITNLWQGEALIEQFSGIACFLLCFMGVQVIYTLQDTLLDTYAYQQTHRLRSALVTTVFTKGPELVQQQGTGSTTHLLVEGIEHIETYIRVILQKMIRVVVVPLVLLIPVFLLDWVSGVVLLIVFPFIVFYMTLLGRMAQEKAAAQHRRFEMLSNHFINSLRGLDTLKLFGVSKQHGKNIFAVSEQFRKATMKTLRVAMLSGSILDLFATLSVAAVAILLGLRLLDGSLVLFPALTILILAPEYFKPLREFAADFHASLDGRNALASLVKLLEHSEQDKADNKQAHSQKPDLAWDTHARFAVNDLGYAYDSYEALQHITFEVQGYTKIGIVGASGAGKSSLLHLLGGFATPSSGTISVKDHEGIALNQPGWQNQVAYLPQNPYIFHASLRDNICFYHPEATEDELAAALVAAGLESVVDELPQGLDTLIGEGQRSLSGGQAQRVALARIWLDAKRTFLLFDEPTAHLDIETEYELKQSMLPLMQNRVVFFATHRLHWMHEMDLILVMEDGRIVQSGTLHDLCATQGPFASLVRQEEEGL